MRTVTSLIRMTSIVMAGVALAVSGGARAEVATCNADVVKSTLERGTFDKFKTARLRYLSAAQNATFQRAPYPNCPPFPSACDRQKNVVDEQNRTGELQFKQYLAAFPKKIAVLENMAFSVANVRQVNYDATNDSRTCVADVQYQNWDSNLIEILPPACRNTVTYKVDKLLAKPGEVYVSWRCD
jgi:hypothetical protein